MGHETLYKSNPSSSSLAYVTLPLGSGSDATSEMPWSIEAHLSPRARSSRLSIASSILPAVTSSWAACALCVVEVVGRRVIVDD
jgi:hypothetical protein